jgi:heterogeneous nuclear ribonucleoprotein A1/A3
MQQNKLFVGSLPFNVDEEHLRKRFEVYGEIEDLNLVKDRFSGQSKGFAFITFATQHAAETALAENGKDMDGRALKVNIAQDKQGRGGRGKRPRW